MANWYKEKKKEFFYNEAKRAGYRARSAFKLLQIQKKFKILRKNNIVIDLGAAPGGWSQVAKEIVGINGFVIGIDIAPIKSISGITFLQGDITSDVTISEIIDLIGKKKVDVVLSDMSPDISGNYSVDQARSVFLCEKALSTAELVIKSGGNFICKIFEGEDLKYFQQKVQKKFRTIKQYSPEASRKSSSEIYLVAKFFQK